MRLLPLLSVMLGLAGALGVLTGLFLLLTSRNRPQARAWLQTDFGAGLDTLYFIERPVYRHHRKAGAVLIAAAVLWMWLLYRLNASNGLVIAGWLLSPCTLVIGLFLLIRPSALKPFETVANRWIEPFALSSREPIVGKVGWLTLGHPRTSGILLLIGGVACIWGAVQVAGA